MKRSELITLLEQDMEVTGDGEVDARSVIELAFPDSRFMAEYHARESMVRRIVRAKREARMVVPELLDAPMNLSFFEWYWPKIIDRLSRGN